MTIWGKLQSSNTLKLGLLTILGALTAYLTGTMDANGAALMALTGIVQMLQRNRKLNQSTPGPFPGIDAGGPGVAAP